MQVKLNLKIFIFVLFFIFTNQLEIYLALMLFALIHEIGHMIMGMILGLKLKRLEIMPFGFAILFKVDTNNYNKKFLKSNLLNLKKLLITLAGPVVNLIFIFLLQNVTLIYINAIIFIFNMIVIYPLDGGRILKYILCFFVKKPKALYITNIVSNIICVILCIFTLYLSFISRNVVYIFTIVYIIAVIMKENKVYKLKRNMYRILENDIAINKE